jgi:tetratricopeptide (TPR) repeat protein
MTEEQWLSEGRTHFFAERYQESLAAYEQAIRLNQRSAAAYCGKGEALFALRRFGEALAAFEQSIRLDPSRAIAYYGKGNVLEGLNRYEEALTAHEHAIRLYPNSVAYNGKGSALEALNRYEEALVVYEQAVRLDPNDADYRNSKERMLRRLGRSGQVHPRYWVMRRETSDTGPGGYYRRMQKYSGPFATKTEAGAKAQELNDEQRRSISDERLDKATRRALHRCVGRA